jgi:lipopolysaccharide/colanic/teichoic acid biosynthesis glycosyltransferase
MTNKRLSLIRWSLLLSYIAAFYLSLLLAMRLRYGQFVQGDYLWQHLAAFSMVYVFWLVVFYAHNLFELQTFRRVGILTLHLLSAMGVSLLVAVTYFYFQPGLILTPRRFLLLHVGAAAVIIFIIQLITRYVINQRFVEQLYLLGLKPGDDLAEELGQYGYLGVKVAGFVDPNNLPLALRQVSLVIPPQLALTAEVLKRLYALRLQAVTFYPAHNLYENLTRKVYLTGLTERWFLENISYRRKRLYELIKRMVDVGAGLLGLLIMLLIFPIISLLIKLNSDGPVFFRQPRIGQYGTIFTVYKFRTMAGGAGNTWTEVDDPRITYIGRILRRLRVDELPQALNLLKGEMSLVGPRPEQPHIVEQLRQEIPFYEERHLVKPGVTGWGQLNVYARSVAETKIKLQYDLYYIKHRSLLFDLEIILKTIYHVLIGQGI